MDILNAVKKLYRNHRKIGKFGNINYDYTCPSPRNYPHQWLWDSCFHAIVLTNFDLHRAKSEIKTLLSAQHKNGFIPCVTIWKRRFPFEEVFYMTRLTQPPVIPLAAQIIYERSRDPSFLKEVYPKLKAFMLWFSENRDSNKNDLIEIIHPWETGIDSTPSFDRQLGIKSNFPSFPEVFIRFYLVLFRVLILKQNYFVSENVLMNSIYAKSLFSMANLAKIIGKKDDSLLFIKKYKKTKEALTKLCWSKNDEIFYDLDDHGHQIKVKSISSLMPLILLDLPIKIAKPLIEKHLLNKKEFWTPFPIASVPKNARTFDPGDNLVLWRGPTWVNTNWFLVNAIRERGYKKEAQHLVLKTLKMIEKSNFWEFYNPLNGEGYGQPGLGWSALVLDMLSSQSR